MKVSLESPNLKPIVVGPALGSRYSRHLSSNLITAAAKWNRLRNAVRAPRLWSLVRGLLLMACACILLATAKHTLPQIKFFRLPIAFHLEADETASRHVPATMAGGVAVFDFNKDGRP